MKKLLLLPLIVLFTGCEFFEKPKVEFANFSKHIIEFRDSRIVLSNSYSKTSSEDFLKRLEKVEKRSKFKKLAITELNKIKKNHKDYELYVDEKNVENYVFVYSRDYVQFDEHSAAKYVSSMNEKLTKESKKQRFKYKRIHGRYFFTINSKIVKLKYLKEHKKTTKFGAEYIVSLKSGGMGVSVSNVKNVDFERSIKRLAYK